MITVLIWVVLLVPAFFAFRLTFRITYNDLAVYRPDAGDVVLAGVVALCGACLWPVILPLYVIWRFLAGSDIEHVARIIGGESRDQKLERMERERRDREERIRDLERQLGVGA